MGWMEKSVGFLLMFATVSFGLQSDKTLSHNTNSDIPLCTSRFKPIESLYTSICCNTNSNAGVWSVSVPYAPEKQVSDNWFGNDKADHLTMSALLFGFGYYAARQEFKISDWASRNSVIGFSLAFGVAKEIYDWKSRKGTPSLKDFIADFVGIGVGFLMISLGD